MSDLHRRSALALTALAQVSRCLAISLVERGPDRRNQPSNAMNLIDAMKTAAGQLQEASRLAHDWRVRSAMADAATMIQCAVFIQEKIHAGRMTMEPHPPNDPVRRRD